MTYFFIKSHNEIILFITHDVSYFSQIKKKNTYLMIVKKLFLSLSLSLLNYFFHSKKDGKNQENEKIRLPRINPDGIRYKADSSSQPCKSLEFSFLGKLMFLRETK